MNRHNAAQFLHLIQALIDGKSIQYKNVVNNTWVDLDSDGNIGFIGEPDRYRVKAEPEYVYLVFSFEGVILHTVKDEASAKVFASSLPGRYYKKFASQPKE